jgi:uncharacterized membrane protein HdeD (DUF308 family)
MDVNYFSSAMGRNWWVLLLRGVVAVLFGLLTWTMPGITLTALVLVFGIYVLADGVLGVWMAFGQRQENRFWWALLLWGLLGVLVGLMTFLTPGVTALVLLMYMAAWAVVTGVTQIIGAIRLRKEIQNEWLLGLSGLISVLFGVLLFMRPGEGALAVVWLIGTYAVIFGVLMVLLSFKLRKLAVG